VGLRERKKQETRQLISDVATVLFLERGFDAVTVAEVAVAANVSTKTVFNYFPRKEDLFLDRFAELTALVTRAVAERPAGQPVLHALRDLLLDLLARKHPLSGHAEPGYVNFWRVVIDSPALQNRAREFVLELEDLVARLFAEAEGIDPASVRARFAGATAVAAYRTVFLTNAHRMTAGQPPAPDLPLTYRQLFAAVDRAIL
jgi:AcrR family transcriptional regulator